MGVLQRIRNGSPRKTANNKPDEPKPRVAQGLKVANLNSQSQAANANNLNPQTSQEKPAAVAPAVAPAVDPFKPRQRQRPQPKFPPVAKPEPPQESINNNSSSTNNSNSYASSSSSSKIMAELAAVTQVYGPHANIYTDVLSISPSATQQEIREAFFCIRYGIYQQLSDEGDNNNPLSMEERKRVEQKMDAVSEAFQVLSDRNRRAMYDAMLAQQQPQMNGARSSGGTIPASKRDLATKQLRNKPAAAAAPDSPLSIGQKRSIYRRQMNAQQRRPIQGSINERKPVAPVLLGETVEQNQNEESHNNMTSFSIRGSSVKNKGQIGIDTNNAEVLEQKQVIEEASPTAVEDFEQMNKFKNVRLDDSPMRTTTNNNNRQDDESPDTDDRTYEDDSRTYDDDSRTYGTYDDESYYTYGDTTLGTYDDSTYVTYDDYDDQTYGTYDDQTYGTYEDDSRGKYSPGHKTKDRPEPILKGSSKKDKKKSNRRVTVISHRGKGGETGGDILPGIDEAFEELSGTYKDFKDTLNQVGSAFILSPDDIDKMSDKIRDAQMELAETYYEKQIGGAPHPKGKKVGKGPKPSKKKAIKS